ncbi:carboxymuconolactone decarboxylase family protein [Chitinophaga sancti]|uniref:Alkylhydroperoxidase family enzyme, contains CxxC motif n=1 Tax=Chitinophaga sancti TaxID=1004 RepID=A0A1K1NEJ3_9BACT|nr:hypothetical protein [Chitinophaga sancti]WQD63279.1 hypothetical protein U0033_02650 [Chitinophaga sancti]WQG91095.1 hypothetical protein SR876_06265 [Chitinophaga sancti]SFW33763.1 hypothetical protein SAMN05661012_01251 [Chitinophaga sancti]
MPRINPLPLAETPYNVQMAYTAHSTRYNARITNMKATLGRSLVAFEVYMSWYPLYEQIKTFIGKRPACLFAYTVSAGSNCQFCSAYFRKIMIDNDQVPEELEYAGNEQLLIDFGNAIALNQGRIPDELFSQVTGLYTPQQVVELVAFAGQMIASSVFNNVMETEIDEYLSSYAQ